MEHWLAMAIDLAGNGITLWAPPQLNPSKEPESSTSYDLEMSEIHVCAHYNLRLDIDKYIG